MKVVFFSICIPTWLALWNYGADAFVPFSGRPASRSAVLLYHNKKKGKAAAKGFGSSPSRSRREPVKLDRFPYSGSIRPGIQSPQRIVTVDSILKPDYWETGTPQRVDKPMFPWMIEVKSKEDIEKMRAAGSLARDILDLAGQAVQVGVTTDEIDKLVHDEIIKVRKFLKWLFKLSFCTVAVVIDVVAHCFVCLTERRLSVSS